MNSFVLPDARFAQSTIIYEDDVSVNLFPDGAALGRRFGPGLWKAKIATAALDLKAAGQWEAFFLKHGDGKSWVRIFYPNRCRPLAYRTFEGLDVAGGGAFDGSAVLFSRVDAFNVQVNQCPSEFELTASDWVGFEKDERFSLHQVVANSTGTAGGEVDLEVFPAIPPRFVAGSNVHFHKPVGEFLIEKGSVAMRRVGRKKAFSFSAISLV